MIKPEIIDLFWYCEEHQAVSLLKRLIDFGAAFVSNIKHTVSAGLISFIWFCSIWRTLDGFQNFYYKSHWNEKSIWSLILQTMKLKEKTLETTYNSDLTVLVSLFPPGLENGTIWMH